MRYENRARELMVGVHRLQALKSDPLAAGAVDALAPALAARSAAAASGALPFVLQDPEDYLGARKLGRIDR